MNPEPSTLLNRAASEGDFEDVCELISLYQFDSSSINQSLSSAVKKSQSTSDHLRCIEYLLRHSGNPNFKDPSGTSLLMTAARLGQIQLAELLVSCGSSVDDRDKDCRTALMYAVESGYGDNVDVVKFLLEKKAKVNVSDSQGNTALHKAAEMGYLNSIEVLIEYGALVNAENKEKNTPLHIAAKNKFEAGIELLVKKKANCKLINVDGKNPVDLAPDSLKELFEAPENVAVFLHENLENSSLCKICKKILVVGICKPCYEFNLAYNRDVVVENRKTIEDYAKEIQELKITNQEINKKNRELTENLQQCKKILVEKDAEIRKKEIELAKIDKENKEKLKKKQTESSALIFRLEEALKEVESLKEQLVNSKNDNKRYRNDCETLRHRLEERSKPDISRKKPLKLSYLKPVQTSSGCSSRDEISVFLQELDKWQEDVFPSYSEITNVIKSLIKTRFPSCTVEIYGSFATRLHLPSSDIDMVIKESECEKRETLRMIEKLLKDQPFIVSSIFINTAFIPVIKAKAELNGAHVQIDITVNDSNHAGLRCLELVSRLLDQSRLIRPVFLVLKHLFSVCDCKEPYTGGLGSYSLFLMVASFVQKRNDFEVKSDLFETLKGFFEFYLNQEVYFAPIVTKDPAGETHLKSENFFDFMRLVVVDPLNPLNNVSSSSDILKITEIFHVAAYNLKKSHFCDCITCSSPIYRMIYETGDYFRGKSR